MWLKRNLVPQAVKALLRLQKNHAPAEADRRGNAPQVKPWNPSFLSLTSVNSVASIPTSPRRMFFVPVASPKPARLS